MATIADILAGIDSLVTPAKRRLADMMRNPLRSAEQTVGLLGDRARTFDQDIGALADRNALRNAGSVMAGLPQYQQAEARTIDRMNSLLGSFAPVGMTGGQLYRANAPNVSDQTSETLLAQTLGRGTGHFGTGEYYVKDKNALANMLSKGKILSENKVPEGMFTPKTAEQALLAHDALREINDAVHMSRLDSKFSESIKSKLQKAGLQFDEQALRHALAVGKNVYRQPGYNAQLAVGRGKDSASTMYMKALGYKGVDVSDLPEMDNTMYGTVIYR